MTAASPRWPRSSISTTTASGRARRSTIVCARAPRRAASTWARRTAAALVAFLMTLSDQELTRDPRFGDPFRR